MSKHFHKVKVKRINKETESCVSIEFDIPADLWPLFQYKHGQNITIKNPLDDIRRSYSICSSPLENKLTVAVKRVPNGVFSGYATEKLKPGDELEIMQPTGSFYTELDPAQKKNYLFFAAGSGITPVMSIIKSILAIEQESTVSLVYGNQNVRSIIFKEALEGLKDKYVERMSITYILSREQTESEIHSGRIDAEKCRQLSPLINYKGMDDIFICGPEQMIFTVKDFLEAEGISKEKIHFELFTTPATKATAEKVIRKKATTEESDITVTVDGRTYEFGVKYNGDTILDAGLNRGINLPYSCKGGVCSTCRAKVLEGAVEMDCNYGLEDDEVAQGYVLTCQSHPRSEKVVVDYDQ